MIESTLKFDPRDPFDDKVIERFGDGAALLWRNDHGGAMRNHEGPRA